MFHDTASKHEEQCSAHASLGALIEAHNTQPADLSGCTPDAKVNVARGGG